jgi:pectinesterase inhibitor-like protein
MFKPFALFFLILYTTLVVTQSRTIQPNDANLIQQTCKNTPNYALCIQYLNSDPKAPSADIRGLSLIMVNVIKTKATATLNKIRQLIGTSPPGQKEALKSCESKYNTIIVADVAQATEALQKGNPKFAEDGANDADVEQKACEGGFSGNSPLTADNNVMHNVATIAAAIIRNLL